MLSLSYDCLGLAPVEAFSFEDEDEADEATAAASTSCAFVSMAIGSVCSTLELGAAKR